MRRRLVTGLCLASTAPGAVSGTLRDASDQVLANQPLLLIVQPPDATLALGRPVDMTPVSQGSTDQLGRFSLTVPDPGALVPQAAPGGLVDFVVYAPGSTARPYYFSRRLVLGPDGYALKAPGSPPSTVNTGTAAAQVAVPSAGGGICTKAKLKELTNRVGIVGQFYSTIGEASHWKATDKASAVWAQFHYGQGADSQIGVAVSESGR